MASRILVVDDEQSIRYTFKVFLTDEGHEVKTAEDHDSALSLARKCHFDLIFIDIILEGKTGIELLESMRKISPNTPVIIITGAPSIETATHALRLGALDYIVKPVRQEDLIRSTCFALKHKAVLDEKEQCLHNLEAIFRSVKDGIITLDENLTVIQLNDAAASICEIDRNSAIGKPLTDQCKGKCLVVAKKVLQSRKPVDQLHLECSFENNRRKIISVSGSPLWEKDGRFSDVVIVVRDETRLLTLERDLKSRAEFENIVGKSGGIEKAKSLVKDLAYFTTTVLITGESGTGKEMIVEALHHTGSRGEKPLVKVNCAALPETLLESELFGHVAGAFTGAVKNRIGRFQRADSGTIFLDEIGETSPRLQLRLLRVLETMEFERVGDTNPVKVDVRVVAATNQNLPDKVAKGEFREDLYYRLKVAEIHLPPLRDRRDDIPLLVNHFLKHFNKKFQKKIMGLSVEVERMFMHYQWPGNIRELKNLMEYMFVRCHGNAITSDHLPADWSGMNDELSLSVWESEEEEAEAIRKAIAKADGNKSRAAELLGMSRRTIYRKMEKYGIETELHT